MSWEAISTIAETVGATAIVISLIYVAIQIRQNSRQVEGPDERAQANELLHELMWAYQNIYSRMDDGTADEVLWKLADTNIGYWMGNPGFREWWRIEHKTPFTEDFGALVDRVCSRIENEEA